MSRERISRRIVVETNVRGRDIGSFVAQAQRELARQAPLPPGHYYEWGGQFENLRAARSRLLAVPAALLLIFLNVPVAATGGVFALAFRGMPFSISAGVGFIARFGVAVLNGVVVMSYVLQMRREGLGAEDAARSGCLCLGLRCRAGRAGGWGSTSRRSSGDFEMSPAADVRGCGRRRPDDGNRFVNQSPGRKINELRFCTAAS